LCKTNERSYKYSYDGLNRVSGAVYAERTVAGTGAFSVNSNGFNENGITYDDNGNIKTLKRNTSTVGGSSFTEADNLSYTYETDNPNQLKSITDGTGASYTGFGFRNLTGTTGFYQYDTNGNLTADPYKGLTTTYNNLNKTDKVTITTATGRYIDYTYNSDGAVLRKRVYDNNLLQSTTDYIGGLVYENTALSYFSMPEGRVVSSGGTLQPEYVITDHQGNARFSFKDNGSGGIQILQENSYYAFGKTMPGSTVAIPTNPNKNLYNGGSEWQNMFSDLPDYYQTFHRNYDPAIGRFTGVDPIPESAESMSTYQYAFNNPVMFNDPLGDKPGKKNEEPSNVLFESFVGPIGRGGGGIFGRIGPGSGNYWSDGIRYPDWSGYGGSQMYRDGLAARMRDIGGLLYSFNSDGSRSLYKVENGVAGYWVTDSENYTSTNGTIPIHSTFHEVRSQEGAGDPPTSWYDIGSKINAVWGAVTPFIGGTVGYMRKGSYELGRYYSSGWKGGSRALIKTLKFARAAGYIGFIAGSVMDTKALFDGKISGGKAVLNLGMGILGFTEGAPVSILYFGVDAFYPGGVVGAKDDLSAIASDIRYKTLQGIGDYSRDFSRW
jgi:RHS repeat-associated protein